MADERDTRPARDEPVRKPANDCANILLVVPTLDAGAADFGTLDLARTLVGAGYRATVVSQGGRLEPALAAAGGEFVRLDTASKNPFTMLRNAARLVRVVRERKCRVVHAHGRAPAWSAYVAARLTRVPFVTTWYKGFREQNPLKHIYNGIMARGDRVIAPSDQIAEIIIERHGTAAERISIVPSGIDLEHYDPANSSPEKIAQVLHGWGVTGETKVIYVVGRLLRRKGHHVVVRAVRRLKDMGVKDFLCVFAGEDQGRTRYTGELWDLVLATGTADVVRLVTPVEDRAAAYAAATVVVSASVQPEGLQRAILEGLAMARPVIVSDLAAGPDVVLAPPAVPEDRMTGLRCPAGDDAALAACLIRLFSMPETARRGMGMRGREWVMSHFNAARSAEKMLAVYADLLGPR
ncbi:MAG TPA: glycosyltransferase [Xanthobacteraceae bacterium]|nr:glycosyltransferase [Xanthobacteraceae bacterium]